MQFEDHFIDQVRNSCSIVHLIGGYVRLKKSGKDYAALCPFHSEKTPSFMVSESKQIFKCFGCGAGGDAFKFIMLMENLSFPESIRYLAERHGIPLPREGKETEFASGNRQRLLKAMAAAAQFFQECLRQSAGSDGALAYLRRRQIEDSTIECFGIGFAPSGNQLLSTLQKQGFALEELEACGLVREGEGQRYDRFRSRIVFPIRHFSGPTIAFGGRILGEGIPKYLNSPETPLYNKSSHLYALDVTRDEIRQRDFAVLVEGYFDCVVPFQYGIRNIVASLGTSLTQNQVKILARYTRKVVVNYDPDSAGVAATMRSIDLFLEQGLHVNIVRLPSGSDPDTFIRGEGVEAYQEKLKASQPYLEFALSRFVEEQPNPGSPKAKQEIVSQMLPYLARVSNRIERAEYVSRIASRLWIDENLIWAELRKTARPREQSLPVTVSRSLGDVTLAERTLLAALLEQQYSAQVLEHLDQELFEGLSTHPIFQAAWELKQQGQQIGILRLRERLEDALDVSLVEEAALRSSEVPLSDESIRGSIQALRRKQYERICRQIQEEIRVEEKRGPEAKRMDELLLKKKELRWKMELDLLH